jgi:hypothetical protein
VICLKTRTELALLKIAALNGIASSIGDLAKPTRENTATADAVLELVRNINANKKKRVSKTRGEDVT